MVEAARIELASENGPLEASTGLGHVHNLAASVTHDQVACSQFIYMFLLSQG